MGYSFRKSVGSFYYLIVRMNCHVSAFTFYLSHLEVSMKTCRENGYSYMYKKAVSKGTLTVKGRRIERILRAPIFEIYYNRRHVQPFYQTYHNSIEKNRRYFNNILSIRQFRISMLIKCHCFCINVDTTLFNSKYH